MKHKDLMKVKIILLLSSKLEEKILMQVNLLDVAFGVATPRRNISPNASSSIWLNVKTADYASNLETHDVNGDEVTLESVEKLYEELYED